MLVLFFAMMVYGAVNINSILIKQSLNYRIHLQYHVAIDNFRQGTDTLTEAVRRYVATMKPEYMDSYFNEVRNGFHREKSLEMIKVLPIDEPLKNFLTSAMNASRKLMYTEYHAMHLIVESSDNAALHEEVCGYPLTADEIQATPEQRHALAQDLLWNDSYVEVKNEIYTYLRQGLENSDISAKARHFMLRRELFRMISFSTFGLTALLVTIFGYVLYRRFQHENTLEAQVLVNARINAQLKEERDKAIQAEKAKSYFFSSVSHDIRTPLNAIIGFSEMLQLGIEDPVEKEKALDAIITSGHMLLELINDVLDLSKLEAGKMEIHPAPTNIASLVNKVTTSFETAISRLSVQLRTEISPMPHLMLDPQRIRQILFNLIGNAVKFTTRGFITVRASYENGTFTMSVTDTGCGISPEDIKKLMQPYVQLQGHDSTTGTGLGLAICKQLSAQMNGTLVISSFLGKGSTFTLCIPDVVACTEQESEKYLNERKPSPVKTQLDDAITTKSFLVVDDQRLNQSILRSMLSRLGIHKVVTASNGQEALDLLNKADNVDIVLTDMFMPVMDGEGLVRQIRKTPKLERIPVYVITADVETKNVYQEMGFDNILIKPITLEKLREFLAQYKPHEPAGGTDA